MPFCNRKESSQRKPLTQDEIGSLFLLAAIICGAWFRLFPVYMAGFPINDGGLFYRMTETILENGFSLPQFVEYNGLEIPFAYPPLGFYLGGIINAILGIELIKIFTYLPAIILIVALFAFFSLANSLSQSKLQAGLATFIFALLPRSVTWSIMGGGITRSLGQLFLILAVRNIYCLFVNRNKKYLLFSILFSSLVCVSHPEAALHTIGIVLVLWVLYGRNKEGVNYLATMVVGTLVLTSIWWLPTVIHLGVAPFVSAAKTGMHSLNVLIFFFLASFSEEPFLTIIGVFAILGVAVKFVKRDYLLPLWIVVPFYIEPRNAPNVAAIPMAMLAGVALTDLIFPQLARIESHVRYIEFSQPIQSRIEKGLLAYLVLYLLTGMHFYDLSIIDKRVSNENQNAFQWVKNNTPKDSKFLVITGNADPFTDWTLEWFPTLTDRISQTTIQGYEWLSEKNFPEHIHKIQLLQLCPSDNVPLTCVEAQAKKLNSNYDYIYISKISDNGNDSYARGNELIFELLQDRNRYSLIYKTDKVVIFKKK